MSFDFYSSSRHLPLATPWLKYHFLFVSQSKQRIDLSGAAGWDVAGEKCNRGQSHCHGDIGHGIC